MQDNETYKTWLRGDPGLLWIFGGPGKGKTMLSIYLTQQFEQRQDADTMYFFCSSEHSTRSTAAAVMRTLLWQITVKRPALAHLVTRYFDPPERTQAMLTTPGSLWEVFTSVISSAEFESMYCLIDGLDECDTESTQWLASQFANLSREGGSGNLHVLIVSRHMSSATHITQIHLDSDNDHNVNSDIGRFTQVKMQELSERVLLSSSLRTRIQETLLKKASGTFLWIGYAMSELSTKTTGLEVEEVVNDLPKALPALYDRMIRRIAPEKLKMITPLLHWIALAVRPLSFAELAVATSWQHQEQTLRDLVKICEPFISVQHDKVVLVHQSAKDYLLRRTKDNDATLESVRITIADAHTTLAKTCLDALGKASGLDDYACSYWAHHLKQCSSLAQIDIVDSNAFFKKKSAMRHSWWEKFRAMKEHIHIFALDDLSTLHIACFLDLVAWVKKVLGPLSRWYRNRSRHRQLYLCTDLQRTPLHYAILGGGLDVTQLLLASGAAPDLSDMKGSTPIWYATVLAQEVNLKLLLKSHPENPVGEKPVERRRTCLTSALKAAIKLNHISLVKLLPEHGADPDSESDPTIDRHSVIARRAPTVLQRASLQGQTAIVQILLDHGADPRRVGYTNNLKIKPPLRKHVKIGALEMEEPVVLAVWLYRELADILLTEGADPNCTSMYGFTLLQLAVARGRGPMVSLLLDQGADPDKLGVGPVPCPLMLAINLGFDTVAQRLLDGGAAPTTKSEQEKSSPILVALEMGRKTLLPKLIEHGALPDGTTSFVRLFWTSILYSNLGGIEYALGRNVDPNTILGGPVGSLTALHCAIATWTRQREDLHFSDTSREIVKCLLFSGADLKLQDDRGRAAEKYAAIDPHVMRAFSNLIRAPEAETSVEETLQDRGLESRPNLQLLRSGGVRPSQHSG
jgi:ankyrin repeat protein